MSVGVGVGVSVSVSVGVGEEMGTVWMCVNTCMDYQEIQLSTLCDTFT